MADTAKITARLKGRRTGLEVSADVTISPATPNLVTFRNIRIGSIPDPARALARSFRTGGSAQRVSENVVHLQLAEPLPIRMEQGTAQVLQIARPTLESTLRLAGLQNASLIAAE